MAWNKCGSVFAVHCNTYSPIPMKRIARTVPTAAPTAPLPPATPALTAMTIAPTAAVGAAVCKRFRTSLDGMAATPLSQGAWGVVMDERSPGRRVDSSHQWTVALRSFGSVLGSREPYHKLF